MAVGHWVGATVKGLRERAHLHSAAAAGDDDDDNMGVGVVEAEGGSPRRMGVGTGLACWYGTVVC